MLFWLHLAVGFWTHQKKEGGGLLVQSGVLICALVFHDMTWQG